MVKIELEKLTISLLSPFAAGILGGAVTSRVLFSWYEGLNKPFFNPPARLFGIVWPILYFLMGIALYLVWIKGWDKKQVRIAVKLFFIHLVFNALWSIIFFGFRAPFLALIEILILLGLIIGIMVKFYRIQKWAFILLIPYLAWVTFATFLNFSIWYLNR
jgi:tryptophan-rich sensory protein